MVRTRHSTQQGGEGEPPMQPAHEGTSQPHQGPNAEPPPPPPYAELLSAYQRLTEQFQQQQRQLSALMKEKEAERQAEDEAGNHQPTPHSSPHDESASVGKGPGGARSTRERRDQPERMEPVHSRAGGHSKPYSEAGRLLYSHPFSPYIMEVPLPKGFKPPAIEAYDGTTDPQEHLHAFLSSMLLVCATDPIKCRAFPSTLKKSAQKWFTSLQPGSITCFDELADGFLTHFATSKPLAARREPLPLKAK